MIPPAFLRLTIPGILLLAAGSGPATADPADPPAPIATEALKKLLDAAKARPPIYVRYRITPEGDPGPSTALRAGWLDYAFAAAEDGSFAGEISQATGDRMTLIVRGLDYGFVRRDGAAFRMDGAAHLRARAGAVGATGDGDATKAGEEAVAVLAREHRPAFVIDLLPGPRSPEDRMFRIGFFFRSGGGGLLRLLEQARGDATGLSAASGDGRTVLAHARYEIVIDSASGWPLEGFVRDRNGKILHRFIRSEWADGAEKVRELWPKADVSGAKTVEGAGAPPELRPYRDALDDSFDLRLLEPAAAACVRDPAAGKAGLLARLAGIAEVRWRERAAAQGWIDVAAARLDQELKRTEFMVREQAWRSDAIREQVRNRWTIDEQGRRDEAAAGLEPDRKMLEEETLRNVPAESASAVRAVVHDALARARARAVEDPLKNLYAEKRKVLESLK